MIIPERFFFYFLIDTHEISFFFNFISSIFNKYITGNIEKILKFHYLTSWNVKILYFIYKFKLGKCMSRAVVNIGRHLCKCWVKNLDLGKNLIC